MVVATVFMAITFLLLLRAVVEVVVVRDPAVVLVLIKAAPQVIINIGGVPQSLKILVVVGLLEQIMQTEMVHLLNGVAAAEGQEVILALLAAMEAPHYLAQVLGALVAV
jgi:hypothetical protein